MYTSDERLERSVHRPYGIVHAVCSWCRSVMGYNTLAVAHTTQFFTNASIAWAFPQKSSRPGVDVCCMGKQEL